MNCGMLSKYIDQSYKRPESNTDQTFFGHGKLLLSGEYFVLDGAKSLALPTRLGQSLTVKYSQSFSPKLVWKAFDYNDQLWFEANYEFWRFNCLDESPSKEALVLQELLRQARNQNSHFLRDGVDVHVETKLDFPREWGLGSSSTLIYNMAQWAYVSPFELLFETHGGSGYDIACAQCDGPIVYSRSESGPQWSKSSFNPSFKDGLYFVYLGKKKNSRSAVEFYRKKRPFDPEIIAALTRITDEMIHCESLEEFGFLIKAHETIVSKALGLTPAKEKLFGDFWGEVKSLGAWGGDFVLVTSTEGAKKTSQYFEQKGYEVIIPYEELILEGNSKFEAKNERKLH